MLPLDMGNLLKWVITVDVPAANDIYDFMKKKNDTRRRLLKKSMCARSRYLIPKETVAEQFCLLLPALLSVET